MWKDRESRRYGLKWRSVNGKDHAVLQSGLVQIADKWWCDWLLS
ncbi:MAG: hypothetical protein WBO24_12240 [Nitrospirales bacterium]